MGEEIPHGEGDVVAVAVAETVLLPVDQGFFFMVPISRLTSLEISVKKVEGKFVRAYLIHR